MDYLPLCPNRSTRVLSPPHAAISACTHRIACRWSSMPKLPAVPSTLRACTSSPPRNPKMESRSVIHKHPSESRPAATRAWELHLQLMVTTITSPRKSTISVPSYKEDEPDFQHPPCMNSITGRRLRLDFATRGANTFSWRQSSLDSQPGPKAEALRTPIHASGWRGGCQRSAPNGGAA